MEKYAIKYKIGDQINWYVLEADSEKEAKEEFTNRAENFHSKNLLYQMSFGDVKPMILDLKLF